MRAIVIAKPGGPDVLELRELPDPDRRSATSACPSASPA